MNVLRAWTIALARLRVHSKQSQFTTHHHPTSQDAHSQGEQKSNLHGTLQGYVIPIPPLLHVISILLRQYN